MLFIIKSLSEILVSITWKVIYLKEFFSLFDLIFSSFIPRFINNIYKCKSVSASGAEQVKAESFFAMYGLYDPYIYCYVFMYDWLHITW